MMKGMFKRALAGVAAAALAATGLALGAGAANAAEGDPVTGGTTFTFTASSEEQLKGRDLYAYKIGDYVNYGTNDKPLYGVRTSDDIPTTIEEKPNTVIKDALVKAGATIPSPEPSDLLTWAMQKTGILDQSATRPWDTDLDTGAKTRQFADYLAQQLTALGTGVKVNLSNPSLVTGGSSDTDNLYQATASLSEPGVWLIIDNTVATTDVTITKAVPMLVYSGEMDPTSNLTNIFIGATVNLKNTKNVDKTKTVDKTSVSVGDTLTYTLTGVVSNPVPASFGFVDKPGTGLTINTTDLKVYACANQNNKPCAVDADEPGAADTDGVTTLTETDDYTTDFNGLDTDTASGEYRGGNDAQFTVTLTNEALDTYKGKMITVVYTAVVNEQAYGQDKVLNKIVQNDGADFSVPTKLFSFEFEKTDAKGNALQGAVFKIEGVEGTTLPAGYEQTIKTSGQGGKVSFTGLASGHYRITEISAPEGYMGYDKEQDGSFLSFTIFINGEGNVTEFTSDIYGLVTARNINEVTKALAMYTDFKVKNVENVTQLPLTGAAGTMLFTVLGLLIAGAGALVYMKSRSVKHALRG